MSLQHLDSRPESMKADQGTSTMRGKKSTAYFFLFRAYRSLTV